MNSTADCPLVSVIINCYNSEQFLNEAIESVLSQTYRHFEIIFWDNQSTDASASIVNSYDDDRIRYFYAPQHTTLGEGRNLALEKCRGELISFLDADDAYSKDRLQACVDAFKEKTVGLVYTNGEIDNGSTRTPFYREHQPEGELFDAWLRSYQVMIPSVMFRRECLDILQGHWVDTRFSMVEEYDFFLRIARDWRVAYCHDNLCMWREHSASMTWSKTERWGEEFALLAQKMLDDGLATHDSLTELRKKSAYYLFLGELKQGRMARHFLKPFLTIDKRFFLLYVSSFLGRRANLFFLRLTGSVK